MEIKKSFVFQTDSDIVQRIYCENSNYLIEYSDNSSTQEYCTIYFCSHNIYYPNEENIFIKRIVKENFYEWYSTRIQKSHKHIFVRDIFKQWYIAGINSEINSPEKLLYFLQQETEGYKVITLGSSAGGYAAILYGSLLNADRIIAFNPQFELNSLLKKSSETINPLLFRLNETPLAKYFDLYDWMNENIDIYYFYSNKSVWDIEQYNHIRNLTKIHKFAFSTAHHGIPFLKIALPIVLNSEKSDLNRLSNKTHNSWLFTMKLNGFLNTILGFLIQTYKKYK